MVVLSHHERAVTVVTLIASILSALGAAFMILGYIFIPTLRTFRHQLILGLAVADLFLALNFFASSFSSLVGGVPLNSMASTTFCSFNGFITQIFFLQVDLWCLVISIYTYIMLDSKLVRVSIWIQSHSSIIWIFLYLLSIACACVGFGVWGFGNIGGWCWFVDTKLRLLLVYTPRWFVIFASLALYVKSYGLIREAQRKGLMKAAKIGQNSSGYSGYQSSTSTTQLSSVPPLPTYPAHPPLPPPTFHQATESCSSDGMSLAGRNKSAYEAVVRQQQKEAKERRMRKVSFLMMAYPVCYAVIWAIPTCILIYELTNLNGRGLPTGLDAISKLFIVLQGFIDAHIYGFNERTAFAWLLKIRENVFRRPPVTEFPEQDDHEWSKTKVVVEVRDIESQNPPSIATQKDPISKNEKMRTKGITIERV